MATRINEKVTGQTHRQSRIGLIGTAARIVLGLVLLGSVIRGEWASGLVPASWVLGWLSFPAVRLTWQ